MITYYKSIGVGFIKVDFLNQFQQAFGQASYETALTWMRQAAGNDVLLSLSQVNLWCMGETEKKYGDMVRVSKDVGMRGWGALSGDGQGQVFGDYDRTLNAFDGLTYFAPISGKDRLILDGEYITVESGQPDLENRFWISLFAISGSPIGMSDRIEYMTAAKPYFQNNELLELNRMGLAGQPRDYQPNSRNSQVWAGKLPNGDWAIALFNRNSSVENRSINFSDLGLTGAFQVRDLWAHSNLGAMSSYSVNLNGHDHRIVRIASGSSTRYEAESATRRGTAAITPDAQCSGGNKVTGVGNSGSTNDIEFNVNAGAGRNFVTIWYKQGMSAVRMSVNGGAGEAIYFPPVGEYEAVSPYTVAVIMNGGANTIRFYNDWSIPGANQWAPHFDCIDVTASVLKSSITKRRTQRRAAELRRQPVGSNITALTPARGLSPSPGTSMGGGSSLQSM
jgi:hypothetical protein